ncbi:unnamed protein product [Symbiodinium sp. CCMP2592]|nr:unnamed protein product [Symbiodinium sp. CCMP2592]CAE7770587.1 unnamed protein product [Symbiodinium sp. CCMP2592]
MAPKVEGGRQLPLAFSLTVETGSVLDPLAVAQTLLEDSQKSQAEAPPDSQVEDPTAEGKVGEPDETETAKPKAKAKGKPKAQAKEKAKGKGEPKAKAKAEPKAKGKAEPKTKAKGKAKAKATAVDTEQEKAAAAAEPPEETEVPEAPTEKKRKATEKPAEEPDNKKPEKKKPSEVLRERATALVAELPEDVPPAKAAGEELQTRDRRKAWFFEKSLPTLSSELQNFFRSKDAAKTKLINDVVKPGATTKWEINENHPTVQTLTSHYRSVLGKTKQKSYPKAIMVGKCGSETAFLKALREGDVVEITDKGQTQYMYRQLEVQHRTAVVQKTGLQQAAACDQESKDKLEAFCDNFDPEFEVVPPSSSSVTPAAFAVPGTPPPPLAILDRQPEPGMLPELDKKCIEKIDQALTWLMQLKQATYRLNSSTSQTWQNLKRQLDEKWAQLLPLQSQLETFKLSNKGSLAQLKSVLTGAATKLLETQELLKGLVAVS